MVKESDNFVELSWLFHNLYLSLDGTIMIPEIGIMEVVELEVQQKRCRLVSHLKKYYDKRTIARIFYHNEIYRCSIFPLSSDIPEYIPTMVIEEKCVWNFFLKIHWALMPYVLKPYFFTPKLKKPNFLVDKPE
jgi:hypothetical protein